MVARGVLFIDDDVLFLDEDVPFAHDLFQLLNEILTAHGSLAL